MKKLVLLSLNVALTFSFLINQTTKAQNTFPSSGNVGIGITPSGYPLEIKNNNGLSTIVQRIWNSNTNWGAESLIRGYADNESPSYPAVDFGFYRGTSGIGDPSSGFIIKTGTNTSTSTKFIINQGGNVGIGTTNPNTKLDVNGIINIQTGGYLRLGPYNSSTDNFGYVSSGGQLIGTGLKFETATSTGIGGITRMTILNDGNVGIGTTTPSSLYKLSVKGKIRAEEIVVETGWSDFVFENDYKLMPLKEVELFIKNNKHLPGIPSAKEIQTDGLKVADINTKMMQKIEEIMLHLIELQKENARLSAELQSMKK